MALIGYSKKGVPLYGPPYTEDEENDFYRRVGGAKSLTVASGPRPTVPATEPRRRPKKDA